ncbi:DUF5979 domain-containing protein [Bifidobacterium eulemuris]|uniref:Uncharacterized protein n=1 Tax=Bifidobacterium eulemuris TaxID=1765219 RepID=A0A7L9SPQ2_9BIFI|nr:DUF5979 domain-containing protein [Bifidobacterium eulemuris]QOL32127.1 hypothetical protein BE0216_06365 [Bifidobacterium eulemuris]
MKLKKLVEGTDASEYAGQKFTFSATVTLPEDSTSTLRDSYPAEGLAEGYSVQMVVSQDGKSGTITGIQAIPKKEVTIKGLPKGATVIFTETGTPGDKRDPSVFSTTYLNNVTKARDGSAEAKPASDGSVQTVTVTNRVSSGNGKLTVTKTFTNLDSENISDQDRYNLARSFQIVSSDGTVPTLTLDNASQVEPEGGVSADNASTVTYTWTMEKLTAGEDPVTLTERGYAVSGVTVTAETAVSGNVTFGPSARGSSLISERVIVVRLS